MITCLAFIIAGAVLLAFSMADFQHRIMFVKKGERVEGTVIRLIETKGDDNDIFYYPLFEININDKETIAYQGISGSAPSVWKVGQKAAFIHTSDGSPAIRRLGYWSIYWKPLVLLAIAIDFLIVGAGYFLLQDYFGN